MWQALPLLGHVVVHGFGNVQCIFLFRLQHGHQDTGLTVKLSGDVRIFESINDVRHRPEGDNRAGLRGEQRYRGKFLGCVALAGGAHHNILRRRLNITGREFQTVAAHELADFIQCQPIAPQGGLGNLNGDLVVARPGNLDLRNIGCDQQIVPAPLGGLLQRPLRLLAVDSDINHPVLLFEFPITRLFGFIRKGVDFGHLILDVVFDLAIVHPRFELDKNHPPAFIGIGKRAADALNAMNRLLDFNDNTFLDFLRGGAFKINDDLNNVERQLRDDLAL